MKTPLNTPMSSLAAVTSEFQHLLGEFVDPSGASNEVSNVALQGIQTIAQQGAQAQLALQSHTKGQLQSTKATGFKLERIETVRSAIQERRLVVDTLVGEAQAAQREKNSLNERLRTVTEQCQKNADREINVYEERAEQKLKPLEDKLESTVQECKEKLRPLQKTLEKLEERLQD